MPTVWGLPFWVSCVIYAICFCNLMSIMIFAMDMKAITDSVRKEVKLKHLFFVFVVVGFLGAWVCLGIYYFFKSNMLKKIWNFRVHPRPEWIPYYRIIGKGIILAIMLLFLVG